MTVELFQETIFSGICSTLGCGGEVGFLFVGLAIMLVFTILMIRFNFSLDVVLVIMSLLILTLDTAGFLINGISGYVWAGVGIIWAAIIFRYARS